MTTTFDRARLGNNKTKRVFNGETYRFDSWYDTKRMANKAAKFYKDSRSRKVRIAPMNGGKLWGDGYALYLK